MEGTGPDAEFVISTRVRLARNICNFPFPSLASDEQLEKIFGMVERTFREHQDKLPGFRFLNIHALPPVYRQVLVEKHLISPLLTKETYARALAVAEDEVVSFMVNEEDHFRIQCILPGLQLEQAWLTASRYDDLLESQVDYAFHEELGFLTACPTNVGTGLRVSVMLHLPALVITRRINHILAAVNQVSLAVRGLYGEGTEMTGNLFQISNQITLGQSEEEIWQNLYGVTRQLINQEKKAREQLLNEGREKLEDRAGRAFGILLHARLLTSQEAMQLLSDVRLGVDLGLIKKIPTRVLNELLVVTRPGCLQYLKGRPLNAYERDLERAVQIQKILQDYK
ncbi:MAG: protein arginine kinase [Firmicutes bacterium]|nr:protein arginine kinase [Bacillota bacterium]